MIEFHLPSKGGGVTHVQVSVNPDSFELLSKLMMEADAHKAIKAFGSALLTASR